MKPPQYDEYPQIKKIYEYKLGKKTYCLFNKKNALYEDEEEIDKPQ